MNNIHHEKIIQQSICWIQETVIGCGFCPFASAVMLKNKVHYHVLSSVTMIEAIESLTQMMTDMDQDINKETSFIIFENNFSDFNEYLFLVDKAEQWIVQSGYYGIYQLASFHPDYCFEGCDKNDPANYTNRSIYPMLHLLREDSISDALQNYKDPEKIPENNIRFTREKGLLYMQMLREGCLR